MHRLSYAFRFASIGLLLIAAGCFESNSSRRDRQPRSGVTASLVSSHEVIRPGTPFLIAIRLEVEKGWHTYWKNPGNSGLPATVKWTLPEGFHVTELQWPIPKRFHRSSLIDFGYEEETLLIATVTPPPSSDPKDIHLQANVRWLGCQNSCVPGRANLKTSLFLTPDRTPVETLWNGRLKTEQARLPRFRSLGAKLVRNPENVALTFTSPSSQVTDAFPVTRDWVQYKKPEIRQNGAKTTLIWPLTDEATPSKDGLEVLLTSRDQAIYIRAK